MISSVNFQMLIVSLKRQLDELLDTKAELSDKLCQIGDSIVYKLVQWTKRLPFYSELPVEVEIHPFSIHFESVHFI